MKRFVCLLAMIGALFAGAAENGKVKFFTTVDILDNYWKTYCATHGPDGPAEKPLSAGTYTLKNMDQMIDAVADLGFSRLYWIVGYDDLLYKCTAALDEEGKLVFGVDLLKHLVNKAHQRKIEIFFIFKPFETGGGTFPYELEPPPELGFVKNTDGWQSAMPFTIGRPEVRLRRRMPPRPADDKVHTIELVSRTDTPITVTREDLELFASSENGRWRKIDDFTVTSAVEEKAPRRSKLVIEPHGLAADDRFFLVKCAKKNDPPQLVNDTFSIVELRNAAGTALPKSVATGRITAQSLNSGWPHRRLQRFNLDTRTPASWLVRSDFGASLETGAFTYDCTSSTWTHIVDGRDGYIAFSTCPIEYLGSLHPAYPEVMKLWQKIVLDLSSTGCDGVDIRFGDHASWTIYGEEYGFNAPVVAEYKRRYGVDPEKEPYDRALWRQLNGEYLTNFMRWCSKTLHAKHQQLHAHISLTMVDRDFWRRNDAPANFKYEWKKWMQEKIVDGVNLKYMPFPWDGKNSSGLQYAKAIIELGKKYGVETNIEARTFWWVQPTDSTSPPFSDEQYNNTLGLFRKLYASGVDALNFYEVSDYFRIDGFGKPSYAEKFRRLLEETRGK